MGSPTFFILSSIDLSLSFYFSTPFLVASNIAPENSFHYSLVIVFPGNAWSSADVGRGLAGGWSFSIGTFTFLGASPFSLASLSLSAYTLASEKGTVGSTFQI